MGRKRHSAEEVINKLRQADAELTCPPQPDPGP